MKRILEYYRGDILAPVGGARGYLYGLKKGLDGVHNENLKIEFLPGHTSMNNLRKFSKTSHNKLIKCLLKLYRRIKHIRNNLSILNQKTDSPVDITEYDMLHFHSASEMYKLRDVLNKYKGKVLFTSHSPQPAANEYIESSSQLELFFFGRKYKQLVYMDRYAFERADYIIFPCVYSEEPYFHYWSEYGLIKDSKKEAYKYLLTGTSAAKVKRTREEVLKRHHIPDTAFVITYVGRHNEIKGYDKLKAIGEILLNKYSNLYFLIAGNMGPIGPLKHDRWIEVGWTNEPHSYTAASNVFVLPNKETYFDLVLLEVLSTGTPIVASRTGGNKYFENFHGVMLYDSIEDAVKHIETLMQFTDDAVGLLRAENKELFKTSFTPEVFAEQFCKIIETCI